MTTLYVYDIYTKKVVAEITGNDEQDLLEKASGWTDLDDVYAATFTPAFGFNDGLVKSNTASIITL